LEERKETFIEFGIPTLKSKSGVGRGAEFNRRSIPSQALARVKKVRRRSAAEVMFIDAKEPVKQGRMVCICL
jgi:hypothetical protein